MSSEVKLPDSIEACHALLRQKDEVIESLSSDCQSLRQDIEQLKRYIYGQRSERHTEDDSQLTLFDQEQASSPENAEVSDDLEEEITYRRRKRSKSDRFPEHLPREVQTLDVPEAERICLCCGDEMPIIATDIRERLEFIPAKMLVHELHYPKRACGKCKGTVGTVTDFKEVARYRLLGTGGFEQVAPDGELKHGKLSEQNYAVSA